MGRPAGGAIGPASREGDCRCVCGSLVARMVRGGVELKCRRCKRTFVVPLSGPEIRVGAEARPGRGSG